MNICNFRGDLTDILTKTEALILIYTFIRFVHCSLVDSIGLHNVYSSVSFLSYSVLIIDPKLLNCAPPLPHLSASDHPHEPSVHSPYHSPFHSVRPYRCDRYEAPCPSLPSAAYLLEVQRWLWCSWKCGSPSLGRSNEGQTGKGALHSSHGTSCMQCLCFKIK